MFTWVETELVAQMNPELSRSPGTWAEQQLLPGESTLIQAIKRLQYYEKQEQPFSKTARYSILDFLGLLACQNPSTYESLVYYYGIYSSSYRGKDKKEEIETELEQVEEGGKRDTINLKFSSSWARLIKKIFEIDPLQCQVCKAEKGWES